MTRPKTGNPPKQKLTLTVNERAREQLELISQHQQKSISALVEDWAELTCEAMHNAYRSDNNTAIAVDEVVLCRDCASSSKPKSLSRYDLYCNNYDVRFCEKEQKLVCGTHFCGYGAPKMREG